MKKLLLIIACAFLGIQAASAQDIFNRGDFVVNAGIGFGNTFHTGSGLKTTVPPISASIEYCIIDNLFDANSSIGVGGIIGYSAQKQKYLLSGQTTELKYSDLLLGARGSFHYQFVPKLDTYAGMTLGYIITSSSIEGPYSGLIDEDGSSVFAGAYIGARYYFTDSFAVMSELGYDVAILKVGVSIKF